MNLQVKQRIPLKIKRMGINGEGIGFYKKTLVFVPGALKGEEVFCQIVSVKRNFVQAKLLKINKASKFRVDPECGVYEECGGCQLMHLRYDKQLEFKTDLLGQALKKFKPANFESYEIRPTIGMKQPQHYRAKLQFQIRSFGGSVKAGLFAEGSHRLINIDDSLVQDELTQAIMNKVTNLLDKYKLPIYNERKISGIRTVMIRRALGSNQVQLIFVTSNPVSLTKLVKELTLSYPEIVKLADGTPVIVAAGIEQDFKITPAQLETAITPKTKAIILCSPSNPTGSVYSKEELAGLAAVLAKHPQVYVIADEIYEHINYIGKHESIAQFSEIHDRVIIVNGVSKAYAMTGWRIGFIAGPEWLVKAVNKLLEQYTSFPCSVSLNAAEAAYF